MENERKTFNKDKKHWLRYLTYGIFINEKYGISSEKIVDFRKALGLIPESKNY